MSTDWNDWADRSYSKPTDIAIFFDSVVGVGVNVPACAPWRGATNIGHSLQLSGISASVAGFAFLDLYNENSVPLSYFIQQAKADGSADFVFAATPAGSRTVDRRAQIFAVAADAVYPLVPNTTSSGKSSSPWSTGYFQTAPVITSDENSKRDIGPVPDEWLDAWADVHWVRYKRRSGRRWHVGQIAQHVHAAFAAHGIDAFEIGLACYDAWSEEPAQPAVTDAAGKVLLPARDARPAGERWSLRMDECFAIEAAWQRRELARQAARIAALETGPAR